MAFTVGMKVVCVDDSGNSYVAEGTEVSVLSEATARPWEVDDVEPTRINCCSRGDEICNTAYATELSVIEHHANAELICRAVNSHDALVKALEKCRKELLAVKDGSVGGIPNSICALIPEAIEQADAALNSVRASS